MSATEIIILAIVQGLTEFLPVSSSGHLVVANAVLEACGFPAAPDLLEVNIVLHMGTLLAVLVFYRREVLRLLGSDRRLLPLLIAGTIPAAAVGFPLKAYAEHFLESPLLAGLMFPVTAALLIWASRYRDGTINYRDLSLTAALKIGCLQALALLPGISRSGASIAGGLSCGLDRQSAGTFAFLLAIPAIGGVGLVEILRLVRQATDPSPDTAASLTQIPAVTSVWLLTLGALISMLVGMVALWWLVRWIRAGRLSLFAWYLIPLGLIVTVWQLLA